MANTLTFANQTITDAHIFGGINYLVDLNAGDEFGIGNTAAASVSFVTDTRLPLYTKDQTNGTFTWTKDGVTRGRYYISEVTKQSGKYTVTAYDAMYLLDAKVTALSLTPPATVTQFANAIASYMGCTISGTINNGSLSIDRMDSDLTIRQMLAYIAEASGCSVKIDGSDNLCFVYYADSGVTITATDYVALEVADYTCAAIDKVVIIDSLGLVQTEAGTGDNALYVSHNPFLENATQENAETILDAVKDYVYTPLTCDLFHDDDIEVGTIVTFGTTPTLVMHVDSSEDGATASSVGSDTRAGYNKSIEDTVNEAKSIAASLYKLEVRPEIGAGYATLTAKLLRGSENVIEDYNPDWFKWTLRTDQGETTLGRGYSITVDMADVGYAGTVLCTFVTPSPFNLTDHNLVAITDHNGEKIQVAFSGASNTKEVNLYDIDGFASAVAVFTGNKGGYVVLKAGADNHPEEILIMDTADIETATNVWRWNKDGIGYSSNGYGGPYATAWTIDGHFVADFITTGMLSDEAGANYWNLDTGQFVTKQGTIADFSITDTALSKKTIRGGNTFSLLEMTGDYLQAVADLRPNSGFYSGARLNAVLGAIHACNLASDGTRDAMGINAVTGITFYHDTEQTDPWTYGTSVASVSLVGTSLQLSGGGSTRSTITLLSSGPSINGNTTVLGKLSATGTKSRLVNTNNYDDRLLYCYETPTPLFGDIGEAVIDQDGYCYVDIDDIFSETIANQVEYQVFLQKEGEGDCWVADKAERYFVIEGTPNLKVAWELKAKQKDYSNIRLEKDDYGLDEYEYDNDINISLDYYITEQEGILYG